MPSVAERKVLTYRLLQAGVIGVSIVLISLGVRFGFQPYGNLPAAAGFAVFGTLTLALGLRGLDLRGAANRTRFKTHMSQVQSQVALLAGTSGSRQGVVLGDWRNARWRDEGTDGGLSAYERLPLLVQMGDVTWPVSNPSKINTGVPIDEIAGMNLALDHLSTAVPGRLSVPDILRDAKLCQLKWRDFDALFEAKLLASARASIGSLPAYTEVGWEDTPWFVPAEGHWRLGGEGFVSMTMIPQQTVDRPRFHPAGSGDTRWFIRLGGSSTWLIVGSQPVPESRVEADVLSVISRLMADPELRSTYRTAIETAENVWNRVNVLRGDLPGYPVADGTCAVCASMWIIGAGPP